VKLTGKDLSRYVNNIDYRVKESLVLLLAPGRRFDRKCCKTFTFPCHAS